MQGSSNDDQLKRVFCNDFHQEDFQLTRSLEKSAEIDEGMQEECVIENNCIPDPEPEPLAAAPRLWDDMDMKNNSSVVSTKGRNYLDRFAARHQGKSPEHMRPKQNKASTCRSPVNPDTTEEKIPRNKTRVIHIKQLNGPLDNPHSRQIKKTIQDIEQATIADAEEVSVSPKHEGTEFEIQENLNLLQLDEEPKQRHDLESSSSHKDHGIKSEIGSSTNYEINRTDELKHHITLLAEELSEQEKRKSHMESQLQNERLEKQLLEAQLTAFMKPLEFSENQTHQQGKTMQNQELRKAIRLKNLAEAKVDALKRQVAFFKKLIEDSRQRTAASRKEKDISDAGNTRAQMLLLKKNPERSQELEAGRSLRIEETYKHAADIAKLQNELAHYKALAAERAAGLEALTKENYKLGRQLNDIRVEIDPLEARLPFELSKCNPSSMLKAQHVNKKLAGNLAKLREEYGQLHETFRVEERRMESILGDQAAKTDALLMEMENFATALDNQQKQWAELENRLKLDEEKRYESILALTAYSSPQNLEDLSIETLRKKLASDKIQEFKPVKGRKNKQDSEALKVETSQKLLALLDNLSKFVRYDPKSEKAFNIDLLESFFKIKGHVEQMREALRVESWHTFEIPPAVRHSAPEVFVHSLVNDAAKFCESEPETSLKNWEETVNKLAARDQPQYLMKVCTLQSSKLKASEDKIAELKKQLTRLKSVAEDKTKGSEEVRNRRVDYGNKGAELSSLKEQVFSLKNLLREKSRDLKNEKSKVFQAENKNADKIQALERKVLEYHMLAEDRAKDLRDEKCRRMELEIRNSRQMIDTKEQTTRSNRLGQQKIDLRQTEAECYLGSVEAFRGLEMHAFVLEEIAREKTETLEQEYKCRLAAEATINELRCHLNSLQAERTEQLEVSSTRLNEQQNYRAELEAKWLEVKADLESRCGQGPSIKELEARIEYEVHERAKLESQLINLDQVIANALPPCEGLDLQDPDLPVENEQMKIVLTANGVKLKNFGKFISFLKNQIKDLELSEECSRYRDNLWRRGLLVFDQVLLLFFAAMFTFGTTTSFLRRVVPTLSLLKDHNCR